MIDDHKTSRRHGQDGAQRHQRERRSRLESTLEPRYDV